MDAIETILSRKSVRDFSDKEINEEIIDQLMKCAMAAPSAINRQPWEFYVVKSEEAKARVNKEVPFGKYKSPIIIVPCIKEISTIPFNHDLAICDLSAATENILLAAHELGLGAVWCAIFPNKARIKAVGKAMGVSLGVSPFCAIYVGYPSDNDKSKVKDKYKKERISVI